MYDICALVAKGFQMMTMGMFKSFYASVVHGKVLEMLSLYLALFKDHFDVLYVCFGGSQGVQDDDYGDVWVILCQCCS